MENDGGGGSRSLKCATITSDNGGEGANRVTSIGTVFRRGQGTTYDGSNTEKGCQQLAAKQLGFTLAVPDHRILRHVRADHGAPETWRIISERWKLRELGLQGGWAGRAPIRSAITNRFHERLFCTHRRRGYTGVTRRCVPTAEPQNVTEPRNPLWDSYLSLIHI